MTAHTPEPNVTDRPEWFAQGPLTDEESSRPGGTPPTIVVASDDPGYPTFVAEFEDETSRDIAVSCVNACASLTDPEADIRALCDYAVGESAGVAAAKIARRWLAAHPMEAKP